MKNVIFILFVTFCINVTSQGVAVNSTGVAPDANTMLDVKSQGATSTFFNIKAKNSAGANLFYLRSDGYTQHLMDVGGLTLTNSAPWDEGMLSVSSLTSTSRGLVFGYDRTNNFGYLFSREVGVGSTNMIIAPFSGGFVGMGTLAPDNKLTIAGNSATSSTIAARRYTNDAFAPYIRMYKSRGTTIGTNTATLASDDLGNIRVYGNDGTTDVYSGVLNFWAAAAPTGTGLATNLYTYLDDGTNGRIGRFKLKSDGRVGFNNPVWWANADFSIFPRAFSGTGQTEMVLMGYGAGAAFGAQLNLGGGRGTSSAATVSLSGDELGSILFSGHSDASTIVAGSKIAAFAAENFTTTATGSELRFYTNATGSTASSQRMIIESSGQVGINVVPTARLQVYSSAGENGLRVQINNNTKLWTQSNGGTSIGAFSAPPTNGLRVAGNATIIGTLTKGGGTFKIDHPKDPENKYLYHSFVESPDMMNVYNGNISTDVDGFATVQLPEYFNTLNKDFRYQLTVIGTFAQAIIIKEVSNDNTFQIKTNEPNVKVSWQVTGIRNDPWANENRVVPEVEKEEWNKGYYLHPTAYGLGDEKNQNHAPNPALEGLEDSKTQRIEDKEAKSNTKTIDRKVELVEDESKKEDNYNK